MLYFLYILGYNLAKVTPMRIAYIIAESLARLYYVFASKDKAIVRDNLKVALGEETNPRVIEAHVLSIFINFAKYLADFFKFPKFTEESVQENIVIEGREHVDKCLREGKGVIFLSVHLGNWELGAAIVGGLGYKISAITLEQKTKRINDFFTGQRAINNVKSIPIGVSVKGCFKALRANETVAIAGDKDYTSTGTEMDFFGKKALIPKGAAVISLKTGAPIVFTILTREKNGTFKLKFEEPIRIKPSVHIEDDVKALMTRYIKLFEKYITRYPDQWYAFQKIWNQERTIQ